MPETSLIPAPFMCLLSDRYGARPARAWLSAAERDARDAAAGCRPAHCPPLALDHPTLADDRDALYVLRINIAGASLAELGAQAGMSGPTVDRIKNGESCQPRVAKQLADRFALAVHELFHSRPGTPLRSRTIAGLRAAMTAPRNHVGLIDLPDDEDPDNEDLDNAADELAVDA